VEALTLITNELVTNAAKYAFVGRERGEVTVGYREEGAGWRLWVEDNGLGLTAHSYPSSGFGRQLIETLAERLNAELAYSQAVGGGTRAEISAGVRKA
jgi:two-component sensor histidine kinase